MTVKELIELLQQFDGDTAVCVTDGSRYGNSYAYDISNIKGASLQRYWRDDDEEESIVQIRLDEQIGVIGDEDPGYGPCDMR